MVIGNLSGHPSLGLGGSLTRSNFQVERDNVVLEAKLDPQKPNEYSVQAPTPPITAPEKISDGKSAGRRFPQNLDPVSRAFNAVADYESKPHKIDIHV